MVTGCTHEEVDNTSSSDHIAFDAVAAGTTRAGEITNNNVRSDGNTLAVWGFKSTAPSDAIFKGTPVTYSTAQGWTYDISRFWDVMADYKFWAVMPASAQVTAAPDSYATTTGFTITNIPAVQSSTTGNDYLISDGVSIAHPGTGKTVEFTLTHILSKFNVLARCIVPDAAKYSVTLKNLDIIFPAAFGTATYNQLAPGASTSYGDGTSSACDAWSYSAGTATTASIQATDQPLYTANYVKLTHSYLVAPTPVTAVAVRTPQSLTMNVTFAVAYDGNGDGDYTDRGEYNETYTYTGVAVQDLHNFTQGYMTNLYVLFDLSSGAANPNIIKFDVHDVTDWSDSDDNYIDDAGHSFSLRSRGPGSAKSNPAPADQTTRTLIPVIIDNNDTLAQQNGYVGTTPVVLTYTPSYTGAITGVKFYTDKAGTTQVPASGLVIATATCDTVPFYVELPTNATTDLRAFEITVTNNSPQLADTRVLTLYQAPAALSAAFKYGEATSLVFDADNTTTIKYNRFKKLQLSVTGALPAAGITVTVNADDYEDLHITYGGSTQTHIYSTVTNADSITIETSPRVLQYTVVLSSGSSSVRYILHNYMDIYGYTFDATPTGRGSSAANAVAAIPTNRVAVVINNRGYNVAGTLYTLGAITGLTYYDAPTGGNAITQVPLTAFVNNTYTFYVALPDNVSLAAKEYTFTIAAPESVTRSVTVYQSPIALSATFTYGGHAVATNASNQGTLNYLSSSVLTMNLAGDIPTSGVTVTVSAAPAHDVSVTYHGTAAPNQATGVATTDDITLGTAREILSYTITLTAGGASKVYVLARGVVKEVLADNENNSGYGDGVNKNVTTGNSTNKGYGQ